MVVAEILASDSAQGIVNRFNLPVVKGLLEQAFLLFLLLAGFAVSRSWLRGGSIRAANALPQRATAGGEWRRGAALGWAMLLAAVLPMMLFGSLHPHLDLAPDSWGLAVISVVTLAFSTLALEVAFRGYLLQRLIELVGPSAATDFLAAVYAALSSFEPHSGSLSIAVTFVLGILYSMAYLRTHALWFGWGLHFGWAVAMAVLLGLPVAGLATYNNVVMTDVSGPVALTGGAYGPEAARFSLLVIACAVLALFRITRDYAWEYTHPAIVAAGYPMTVAPPTAHAAMETAAAARPAPLVQILATTPSAPVSPGSPAQLPGHLRPPPGIPGLWPEETARSDSNGSQD